METIILVVSTFTILLTVTVCLLTVAVAAGRRGLLPHVEHHTHHTVVSGGARVSLSSTPTGLKPGAENWALTVRGHDFMFCSPPPLPPHSGSH